MGVLMLTYLLTLLETDDDRTLLTNIYEKYADLLNAVARCTLYDNSYVDDCVQDTFVELIKSFERFKKVPVEQQKKYILTICRRVAYKINNGISVTQSFEELDEESHSTGREFVFTAYDIKEIAALINMIDAMYREPLTMKYMAGLSTNEIAEALGISKNLVLQRIYRGKKILYKLLTEE